MRAQRGGETEVLEHRRSQPAHDPPDVGDRRLGLLARALHELVAAWAAGVVGRLERERDAGQRGAEAVVQLATQPAALLLAGGDDGLARVLDLRRHPQRVEHERELAHEDVGERDVRRAVALTRRPRADDEPPQCAARGG